MARKTYVVANGITLTPGKDKDKLTGGDEITLSEAEAAPLVTAGYLKEAPPPRPRKNADKGPSAKDAKPSGKAGDDDGKDDDGQTAPAGGSAPKAD